MKPLGWGILIITILVVAALSFYLDLWAGEWKNQFFYLDNWWMWVVVVAAVWVIKKIFDWTWKAELRLLK